MGFGTTYLLTIAFTLTVGDVSAGESSNGPQESNKPYGISTRVPWTSSRVVGSPEPPPPYRTRRAYSEQKFNKPVFLSEEPDTGRLLVAELNGKILALPTDESQASEPQLFFESDRQIYAFSFHPKYRENGYVFIFSPRYVSNEVESKLSRVSRFETTLTNPRVCRPETEKIIVEWPQGGHNGGEAIFGPDGYLYVSTGDSTSSSDVKRTGQGVDDLLSVIMRLDVDNPDPGKPYGIPDDNPFVGMDGARPEIWAFGFRNPWRLSFDREGRLWVGDVGQDIWEMIWLVQRGGNYGWSVQEGAHPFHLQRERGPGPILPPLLEHHHTESRSITGGYVYYGDKFPDLHGAYIYGDYESGKIWGARYDGKKVDWQAELADTSLRVTSFANTARGDVLTIDHVGGEIFALERRPANEVESQFPTRLSESGLFESVKDLRPAPGVIPYSVNAPGWHDGAMAERLLAMSGETKIAVELRENGSQSWEYPDDSVILQTLSLEMEKGDPSSRRRIESRMLVKQNNLWLGYTYLWNDEQTDAQLVGPYGTSLTLKVTSKAATSETVTHERPWHVPSRTECMFCHSRAAQFVIGLDTRQLNRNHTYGDVTDNQLRTLNHIGIFEPTLPEKKLEEFDAFPNPYDDTADTDRRARAYLEVNCSICHVGSGGGNSKINLNYESKLEGTGLLSEEFLHGSFGLENARLVKPGDPYGSVLFQRMWRIGRGRMPRVGSVVADDQALQMVYDWILALKNRQLGEDVAVAAAPLTHAEEGALSKLHANGSKAQRETEAALRFLVSSPHSATALAHAMSKNPALDTARATVLAAVQDDQSGNVRDLFERYIPINERVKRLGQDVIPDEILSLKGDAERGRRSFLGGVASTCKVCHRIDDEGGLVGPDLGGIGKKYQPRELLESILHPSKQIDPKYNSYLLVTTTGAALTGILVERTDQQVVIRDAKGEEVRVPTADVAALEAQKASLMPELLLRDWTARETADVLEFLSGLKGPEEPSN